MSLSILTVAIGLCVTIVYLVKQVYVFQIKEYRLDRIWARIEDKGILYFPVSYTHLGVGVYAVKPRYQLTPIYTKQKPKRLRYRA